MEPGVLTPLLRIFMRNFTDGSARITPDALALLGSFFIVELILLGLYYVTRQELDISDLLWKVMTAASLGALIYIWPTLIKVLIQTFVAWGLRAGGEAISYQDFTDPDNIALYGLSVTAVVFQHLKTYTGIDALTNIVEILFSGGTAWMVIAIYFSMAVWVFITILEFYASTSITIILLPWGMWTKTAWMTERAIAHLFASSIRLLVLSLILGVTLPTMVETVSINPSFAAVCRMFLAAAALLILCLYANSIAHSILAGSPQLTTQAVTQFASSTAMLTSRLTEVAVALKQQMSSQARPPAPPPAPSQERSRP